MCNSASCGRRAPDPGRPLPNPGRPLPDPGRPLPNPGRPLPNPGSPLPDPGRLVAVVVDALQYLLHQVVGHDVKVGERVLLVDVGHEEVETSAGQRQLEVGAHQAQVGAVTVETVHAHHQVKAVIVATAALGVSAAAAAAGGGAGVVTVVMVVVSVGRPEIRHRGKLRRKITATNTLDTRSIVLHDDTAPGVLHVQAHLAACTPYTRKILLQSYIRAESI